MRMNDPGVTATEKGLAFEQRLARLFEQRGYEVVHNAWLTGRSGAQHQVDVLVRYAAPLHAAMVIVEAKAHRSGVDKGRIMKLIQIVDDVGADRGIIVTTSHFTADAVKTAEGRAIDLWDRAKLQRLLGEMEISSVEGGGRRHLSVVERAVAPKIDADALRTELEQAAQKRARGVLGLGRVREIVSDVRPVYRRYYDVELEVQSTGIQRVGLFKKEEVTRTLRTCVSFDAALGSLVAADATAGLSYAHDWLRDLSSDELKVMQAAGDRTFGYPDLAAIGVPDARVKRAVASLRAKEVLKQVEERPPSFRAELLLPSDVTALAAISDALDVRDEVEAGIAALAGAVKEPGAIASACEAYWPGARVGQVRVVHYPFVCALYTRPDGSVRTETYDGVSGRQNDVVNDILRPELAARAGRTEPI
jgi:Holliday junction resolvase